MHGSDKGPFPAASALVARPAFQLGSVAVDPATRTLTGPAGAFATEPRIMQVLLELADADGDVVTRGELLQRCWKGTFVGEDALNRSIFELRRALQAIGAGLTVKTIPKTGYRLAGLPRPENKPPHMAGEQSGPPSRRLLLGGLACAAAVGAAAWFWPAQSTQERQAAELVERGDVIRRDDLPDAAEQGIGFYREALKLAPNDAAIWGKLALALAAIAEYAQPEETAHAVRATELAARRALAIRPGQPDARVALAVLTPDFGAWGPLEQTLRGILADSPGNVGAQASLSLVLMEVGRVGAGAAFIDRLVETEPLSPEFQYRRTYQLWARGRLGEADQVADRALQLWPRHPGVWLSRMWTFALAGRAPAAIAMIDDRNARPAFPAEMLDLLRLSCVALDSRSAADVAKAVTANVAAARLGQFGVVSATLVLPELGETDTAYEVNRGYLLREGPIVGALRRPADQPALNQQNRRKTMPLWMPSAAALRADPRFLGLCESMGMATYWRKSGHGPDFLGSRWAG